MHMQGDLLVLKWVGELRPEDIKELHVRLESALAEHPHVVMLVDATVARGMGPAARKTAASWTYADRLGGVAIVGASRTTRALVALTMAVIRLLYPAKAFPTEFVETEQAGLAWLDQRRRELQSDGR
jgi:hypothetical protein